MILLIVALSLPPVYYTPPHICDYIPHSDWEACDTPEEWTDVCALVTSYYPFDESGNPVRWNVNADSDPSHTADGTYITADTKGLAAVPLPILRWANRNGRRRILLREGLDMGLSVHDTYGNLARQRGIIWHEHFKMKLFPIDLLSDEPTHAIVCDWAFQ